MRNRLWAALAMTAILVTALPLRGAVYLEADDGLLGTMKREAAGRVKFSRLANVLSAVMADSGIRADELLRLRAGRKVVIREEYLDPDYRVPREVILESKRILQGQPERVTAAPDRALAAKLEFRFKTEKLAYENRLAAAGARITELTNRIETERQTAAAAAKNAESIRKDLETKLDGTVRHVEALEKEASSLRTNVGRELLRALAALPGSAKALWLLLGAAFAVFASWAWLNLSYKRANLIRPLCVMQRGPNGERVYFDYVEDEGGYAERPKTGESAREVCRRLKLENLSEHLAKSKDHVDLHIIRDDIAI